MATLAELRAKREKLVSDLSDGATVARTMLQTPASRREVEYRSIDEIRKAIAMIDREIAQLSGQRATTFLPTFGKGL